MFNIARREVLEFRYDIEGFRRRMANRLERVPGQDNRFEGDSDEKRPARDMQF